MLIQGILGFDIDGTLTHRNQLKILPKGLVDLLCKLDEFGYYSIPVTGKPAAYVNRLFDSNQFVDRGIIAENAGVYKIPGSSKVEIFGPSNLEMQKLKELLGLKPNDGGITHIQINHQSYQVAVDPDDVSILTIFTDPESVRHKWPFKKSIEDGFLYEALNQLVETNNWQSNLEVLEPFPDKAIQVIRKDPITGKTINKSLLPDLVCLMYGLEKTPPIAMFGDGHNDIPAMTPQSVFPITFSNANEEVKQFVLRKSGLVTQRPTIQDLGIIEGLLWLVQKTKFFSINSGKVEKIIDELFPELTFEK